MNSGEEELISGYVIRVFKGALGVGPYKEGYRVEDFLPSSEDKLVAKQLGREVRLSVFDRERTTPLQVAKIRKLEMPFHACRLAVGAIRKVRHPQRAEHLSVVREPLIGPDSKLPGADGHCGLCGLDKVVGETRRQSNLIIAHLCAELKDLAQEEALV